MREIQQDLEGSNPAGLLERVLDLAMYDAGAVPASAHRTAVLSLYDWVACGLAGRGEPVALAIRSLARSEGGREIASMIGGGHVPPRMAALVNGTTSHALDFDDTHFGHVAHPSVAIFPAALAAAEEMDTNVTEMVDAFVLGAEASIHIGKTLGADHYDRGFHQTATAGAFGATIAAARLYGLDRQQVRAALALCATRASGLKSQFGTMGKPYNAGIAASNGIEAAKLAQLGFSAPADGLMGAQGFVPTHSSAPNALAAPSGKFLLEDIRYKFHACCHGTHAMLEALHQAMQGRRLSLSDIAECRVRTNPRWMSVCNIPSPETGLEVKFSYRWLAGLVLDNRPTGSIGLYADALTQDQRLINFAERVKVISDETVGYMRTDCELLLQNGQRIDAAFDLDKAVPVAELETRLRKKTSDLFAEHSAVLDPLLERHEDLRARDIGIILRDGPEQ